MDLTKWDSRRNGRRRNRTVDKIGLDETGVDEMGLYRLKIVLRNSH